MSLGYGVYLYIFKTDQLAFRLVSHIAWVIQSTNMELLSVERRDGVTALLSQPPNRHSRKQCPWFCFYFLGPSTS